MDEPQLRQLLGRAAQTEIPPLPGNFTDEVLRQTRFRETAAASLLAWWPMLTATSVLALSLAGGTGFWLARDRSPQSPPPLTLFQAQSDTAPFLAP